MEKWVKLLSGYDHNHPRIKKKKFFRSHNVKYDFGNNNWDVSKQCIYNKLLPKMDSILCWALDRQKPVINADEEYLQVIAPILNDTASLCFHTIHSTAGEPPLKLSHGWLTTSHATNNGCITTEVMLWFHQPAFQLFRRRLTFTRECNDLFLFWFVKLKLKMSPTNIYTCSFFYRHISRTTTLLISHSQRLNGHCIYCFQSH